MLSYHLFFHYPIGYPQESFPGWSCVLLFSSLSYQTSYFQLFFVLWPQSQKCLKSLSTRLICTDILQNYGAFIFFSTLMNGDVNVPTKSGARDIIYITHTLDTSYHLKNSTLSVFLSMFIKENKRLQNPQQVLLLFQQYQSLRQHMIVF